jgi:hypothetical protein
VVDHDRQRAVVPGPDVDEVDVQAVDLGGELRQGVAVMRRRRSVSFSSGMSTRKGRIPVAVSTVLVMTSLPGKAA